MAEEKWKPVVHFEGVYEVSSTGRMKSLYRVVLRSNGIPITVRERILKTPPTKAGYPEVRLYPPGGGKHLGRNHFVHRLMLEAFVGPCPEGMEACHLNDTPDDNRLENLRWGTSSENKRDLVRNGNHGMARKTHCIVGHPFKGRNVLVDKVRTGERRTCWACKLEHGNARTAKRPFSVEKSWIRFNQLMEG